MDVVFITDHLINGGADAQLVRIATTLKSRGWSVGVLTMLPSGHHVERLTEAGIPTYVCERAMPTLKALPLAMALKMALCLARWRPKVVVTFNYHADILGRICSRLAGVRHVLSSLRTAYVKTRLREATYRYTEPLIRLTVSNSHAAIRYMLDRDLLTPMHTLVIPNGIDPDAFVGEVEREAARAELGVIPDAFLWLAIGNLRPAKDYPTLLGALALAGEQAGPVQLAIAGDGEEREALIELVRAKGLADRVFFLGTRRDVGRLLCACDAYVLSSAWEGMPNTVMEAMACGVPVVSTDAGGVRELAVDGETAFIAPCRDPEALAARMRAMMAMGAEERQAMGRAGRERILRCFDNARVVDTWESTLLQTIRSGGEAMEIRELESRAVARGIHLPPPAFVVSMDFELFWGMREKRTLDGYGANILGERQAIPAMLTLFRRYGVRVTWAAVGMASFATRRQLLDHLPDLRPTYLRRELSPYGVLEHIGQDEASDPYHFGESLLKQVLDCDGMEVGSHTFSHFYCLESGQDRDQFRADLAASAAALGRLGVQARSFVFPRNQYNQAYLSVCSAEGFKVFRGNEDSRLYRESVDGGHSPFLRVMRLADHYLDLTGDHGFTARPFLDSGLVNVPSSRFLRPHSPSLAVLEGLRGRRICRAMERAARRGETFHLWWHPHNFGVHLAQNLAFLERILAYHRDLRERYGVVPQTMSEAADAALGAVGRV